MNAVAAVVIPVFGTVALGYGLARSGLFSRETGNGLVRFMYYLAIPAMLFGSLAGADLPPRIPWSFLLAFYLPAGLTFWLGMRAARTLLGWQRREEGMAGMTAAYANIVLLGYPLILAAFGTAGTLPLFILLATQSTLLFPLTTYVIEVHGNSGSKQSGHGLRAMARLALNPVIVSLALGFSVNLMSLTIPAAIDRMLQLLSAAGPGCALIALGISLAQFDLGGSYRGIGVLVALKNLFCPAAVGLAGILLDIERSWLEVAVMLAAMPSGINAFIFSSQYGLRQEDVAKTIVISTVVSCIVASLLLGLFMH